VHRNRLIALAGVIIGVIGLFIKSLNTDGEGLLETLNAANPDFPDGIPTIWGGLDTWAQVVLVILIIVVVVIAVRPDIARGLDRNSSMIVAGIGVALLAYAVIKWMDAGDKADNLQAAFGQAAEGGAIPAAFEVSRSVGFLVLIVGTVLVLFAGAMGFMGDVEE
jgi:membrane protease YdiL (CAAX protease family)